MKTKLIPAVVVILLSIQKLLAQQGDDNPTGVAGSFNGEITTGCAYDSYTGNARRSVDDIVVPGSIGAYPLKWTRHFNSHVTYQDMKIGGYWRFSYLDYQHGGGDSPCHPDGRRVTDDYGVEEFMSGTTPPGGETLNMADGGKVISSFNSSHNFWYPVQIIDPYGQVTTLSWTLLAGYPYQRLDRVTEPGGRYLRITWDPTNTYIGSVSAFDGVSSQPTQWVAYTWQTQSLSMPDGTHAHSYTVLTGATYSDGTSATYTYTQGSYPIPLSNCSTDHGYSALLATADDVRYTGPMRQIAYQYYTAGNKTRVLSDHASKL